MTERFNRSVAHFAFDQPSPIAAQAQANYAKSPIPELPPSQFKVNGGLTFAGVGGNPRTYWDADKRDFMPRLGFAYQLAPRTTLRGGYGIFFDTVGVNKTAGQQAGFSQATPIQASIDSGLTYVATNANPLPTGLLPPRGAEGGLSTNLGQSVTFYPEHRKRAYVQRWSFGVQQQVAGQFLVEATYVGNRGTRVGINHQLDNTPAQYLSTSPTRDATTINFLSQSFPNPFFGTAPIYTTNISRANLLRPWPQFTGVSVEEPVGYYVVSRAADAHGEALLARVHGPAVVHVVEGDAGDGVSESDRSAALRIDLGPRPDPSPGDDGNLGSAVRARAASREHMVAARSTFCSAAGN